jgi:hypothetical protein
MPKQNDSDNKKTCNLIKPKRKAPRTISRRGEWSSWMNGADPEWFHTLAAKKLAQVFGGNQPQWFIQSDPWKPITPGYFKSLRKTIMRLSVAQCAAYLRVPRTHISAWESGKTPVPFSAYEALRLQYETNFFKMSHRVWDGWYIEQQTGKLISPDNGKIAVLPGELNTLLLTYGRLSSLEETCTTQSQRIDALEAENAALRGHDKVRAVTVELENMQATIADLLSGMKTAEIHLFPIAELPARATVGA